MLNNERINGVIKALQKNNIDAVYASSKEEACLIAEKMLFSGCVITAGGSVSLKESGVWDLISKEDYRFVDRSRQGISEAERTEAFKTAIGCDFFFCSSNAVTETGELLNVDGFANRIASIAFGPKKVIMVVGINKIVKNLSEAFLRVKKIAAPKNCVRLGLDTPCHKLGHCVSLLKSETPDFTDGCQSPNRICASYLISGMQREKGRITVILCGDELGY